MQNIKDKVNAVIVVALIAFISQFIIGKQEIPMGHLGAIPVLPMVFGVILGMFVTTTWLSSKLKLVRSFVNKGFEAFCTKMVGFCLLVLGTQYAGMVVPNLKLILASGLPLLFQELGNLLPIFIAIPLAVKFGFGRRAIGACSSISREPSIAVIETRFGAQSQEYIGVLAIYLCGSIIGTLWFSLLGSLAHLTGLHPLALAAGTGVGSGSMFSAASASLVANLDPVLKTQCLSIGAASNLLSSVLGAFSLTFLGLPLAELMYRISGGKKKESNNE